MVLDIYFDGGTKGNRVCIARNGSHKIRLIRIRQTNNQLEYSALIFALRSIFKHSNRNKPVSVNIMGDSRLIIEQMNGKFSVKSENLIDLHDQAVEELKSIENVNLLFYWVPRDENLAGIELDK